MISGLVRVIKTFFIHVGQDGTPLFLPARTPNVLIEKSLREAVLEDPYTRQLHFISPRYEKCPRWYLTAYRIRRKIRDPQHGRNSAVVRLSGDVVKFFITWCFCGVGVNTFEILSIKGNQLSR